MPRKTRRISVLLFISECPVQFECLESCPDDVSDMCLQVCFFFLSFPGGLNLKSPPVLAAKISNLPDIYEAVLLHPRHSESKVRRGQANPTTTSYLYKLRKKDNESKNESKNERRKEGRTLKRGAQTNFRSPTNFVRQVVPRPSTKVNRRDSQFLEEGLAVQKGSLSVLFITDNA